MLEHLPREVQQLAEKQYELFEDDPHHPSLQFKQVRHDPPIFSGRVGIRYRALARSDGDDLIWFWIGSHNKYDKLLKRLRC